MGDVAPFLVNDSRIVAGYPVNGIWRIPLASWDPVLRRHTAGIDRVYAGPIDPTYYGSLATEFTFKRLNLNAMMDYSGGNKKIDFSHYWDTRVRSGDRYLALIHKPDGAPTPAGDSLVDYVNVIGSTVFTEDGSYMLVMLAPIRIPGQSRGPKISSAARAMPVGGHTSVAKPATGSNVRPRRAATM